jgi:CHAT domain-containing protein
LNANATADAIWKSLKDVQVLSQRQRESIFSFEFTQSLLDGKLDPPPSVSNLPESHNNDPWLVDFLRQPSSKLANKFLLEALEANHRGDSVKGLLSAKVANRLYSRAHNFAGSYRSELEIIYALRRQSEAQECIRNSVAHTQRYFWISAQIMIERSVCEEMLGHFDEARQKSEIALKEAQKAGYPDLLLRAFSLQSALDASEGRKQVAWNVDHQGLKQFWSVAVAGERGFQFYSDLELMSEESSQWRLAAALQSEALAMLAGTHRLDFQALAYAHLSAALANAGAFKEAKTELAHADALFQQMPSNASTRFYQATAQLSLLNQQFDTASIAEIETMLEQMRTAILSIGNISVRLPYEKAWIRLDRQKGDTEAAANHISAAIKIAEQGFTSAHSEKDRWAWRKEVDQIYRRALEIQIHGKHCPKQVLASWELYRYAQMSKNVNGSGASSGNSWAPGRLNAILTHQKSSSFLSIAPLENETVLWLADDRGVQEVIIPVGGPQLQREIQHFQALCADPSSPLKKVNSLGSRLYELMIKPLAKFLEPERVLLIETDEFTSANVWPALLADDGIYFGRRFAMALTPGIFFGSEESRPKPLGHRMVAVYPGPVRLNGTSYLGLPTADEEIRAVSLEFRDVHVLSGAEATKERILRQLSTATVFHFLGHAITRNYGGELVIRNADGSGDLLAASSLADARFKQLDLVVLSACSTSEIQDDGTRDPNALLRAFLSGGARNVLATRWEIDSTSTTKFISEFYRLYYGKQDAAKALRAAYMAASAIEYRHPYYWASMQLFTQPH